ncbi:MAG: DMT family transporter [Calditrichaeota bacterium]|nr:DMT family transporter [Calditrichota bacterium]MCB9067830.1 DMT family transporter [Calditrichia bacterium]
MQNDSDGQKINTYLGLLLAVLAVAFAAIFVRWCGDTPSMIIAFYRMFWATGIFALLQWRQKNPVKPLPARSRWQIFFAGLMLALHFVTWIGSLKFTTVAHALIIGSTGPVFALIFAPFLLKEHSDSRAVFAVALATAGVLVIALQDWNSGSNTGIYGQFFGDMLALSSAVFVTLYFLTGRKMRNDIPLVPYLLRVYGSAAFVLLVFSVSAGYPLFDHPAEAHFFMLMLAIVPTGVGHSMFNWAARRIEVYKVNLAGLGEPLLASILAFFLFNEIPQTWFYAGALLIFVGIVIALWERKKG